MIHINKIGNPPEILSKNSEAWTKELEDYISTFGGYDKIPDEIKNKMWIHYRHPDIKKLLFDSSYQKCAFCEAKPAESGNIEVEHFKPKSLYPQLAFCWENFLPVCRKCNDCKNDFDTGNDPIINPVIDNPEDRFTYNSLDIKAIHSEDIVAERTIEVCNLNSVRLYEARATLLVSLSSYQHQVEAWLVEIEEANTPRKKTNKINKLKDSIEMIEILLRDEEKYAGFCRNFIKDSFVYKKAKELIKGKE
ncbi:MAG: hypothetical protein PHY47_28315 [Lachnospiraceae bacterium]|nr:hypothetical protein [Lachnospiraceae bacterium]